MALTKATPNILDGVQWEYNTKDDMLVATRHKVGDYVSTLGYERPGDGGAAIYKIVAAGTGTDDGGVVGTTGTDGNVTVAVQSGVLKIENRTNGSRDFEVSWE